MMHGQHVEIQDLAGAHIAHLMSGALLTVGATFGEEIYGHPRVGLLNATKAGRIAVEHHTEEGAGIEATQVPLNSHIIRVARVGEARSDAIDPGYTEQADQPIMFIETAPASAHLFGGQGKVAKFDPNDPPTVDAFIFQPSAIEQVRVRCYGRKGSTWVIIPDEKMTETLMI